MQQERLRMLREMPLLGGVRDDVLELLLDDAAERHLAAGEILFHEGEPGGTIYLLEAGELAAIRRRLGLDHWLGRMHAGDCVGEMSFIDLGPRSASVVAVTDAQALELTHSSVLRLYESDLEQFALIQMNMAREMSRRLRGADDARY
ncbi:MAG: cyclic nucleotide-binding domain-containing protein [Thiohalocapsa sp.]